MESKCKRSSEAFSLAIPTSSISLRELSRSAHSLAASIHGKEGGMKKINEENHSRKREQLGHNNFENKLGKCCRTGSWLVTDCAT